MFPLMPVDATSLSVLHVAVEWVDGHGGVFHDNLPGAGLRQGGIADLQRGAGLLKPCRLILRSRHRCVRYFGGWLGMGAESSGQVWNKRDGPHPGLI